MKPIMHIILGLFFSVFVLFVFPEVGVINSFLIFLASFLIDVDHYLVYVRRKKDLSLKKSIKYFYEMAEKIYAKEKKHAGPLFFLHTIEVNIFLLILSLQFDFLFYVVFGFVFHLILDAIELIHKDIPYSKYFSLVDYFKNKNKRENL